MSVEVTIRKEDNYILAEYSGEYQGNLASLKIADVLKVCQKHKYSKLLVDITNCELRVSTIDRFKFAKEIAEKD